MMNPVYRLSGLVILLLGVLLAFNYVSDDLPLFTGKPVSEQGDDDDDTKPGRSSVSIIGGQAAVRMDMETQRQANIRTIQLESAEHQGEIHAYARVLDIQPLLDWWSRYRAVLTERKMAETAVQISRQEFERLKLLRSEASNISERQLQQARLQWVNDQSALDAAVNKLKDIRIQLLQGWGNVLAEKLMEDEDFSRELFERRTVLLLVILEGNAELPENTADILITEQGGNRDQAQTAHYLSQATFPDNQIYGRTYFFHTPAASLRTGVYLDAWITLRSNTAVSGVYIPQEAVIWYADKPWVYIKADEEVFLRRDIDEYTVTRAGWFVQEGFNAGELIVLHGAQMLLSEEFRWSIPDEDDDP
jgi:hypothetical protein